MSDSTAALSAGDVVGKYKILGMAGAGGMGVVYRALDTKLERTVALKFLPEQAISSPEEKDRFLREARFASSLDHPNIGVIHGIEEHGHRTFIVMAYYTGETVGAGIPARVATGLTECRRADRASVVLRQRRAYSRSRGRLSQSNRASSRLMGRNHCRPTILLTRWDQASRRRAGAGRSA